MGLTVRAFRKLHVAFIPHSFVIQQKKEGRKRLLATHDVLALVLHWLHSTMRQSTLCQLFGIVPSSVTVFIQQGLTILHKCLGQIPEAVVKWPSPQEMEYCAGLINARENLLRSSFGFVDGLNLPVMEPSDPDVQNAYYNGWLSGCYVSNVLVFLPTGKVCFAALNKPGAWHDAQVAQGLFDMLHWKTPEPYNLLADSAFPASQEMTGRLLVVKKSPFWEQDRTREEYIRERALDNAVKRQRQAAEWGMRSIQSEFQRLKLPMSTNKAKRKLILETCIMLHNFRSEEVGLNQIRTVFVGTDKVREYYGM